MVTWKRAQGIFALILFSSAALAQDIIVGVDLSAPARTPEEAVAAALEVLCPKLTTTPGLSPDSQQLLEACNAILPAGVAERAGAYRDLSARSATAETTLTVRGPSAVPLETIGKHLAALRHSMSGRVSALEFRPLMVAQSNEVTTDVPTTSTLLAQRWSGYVSGSLTQLEQAETDTEAHFEGDGSAVTFGVDYRHDTNLFIGLASRLNRSSSDIGDNEGKVDGNDLNITAYATFYRSANWYLEGTFQFSSGDFDLTREISFAASGVSFRETADSSTNGDQRGFSLGAGYHRLFENGVSSLTTATYRAMSMDIDGYTEHSGGGFNLIIAPQSMESSTVNLAAHISRAWSTQRAVVLPQLTLSYTQEFNTDGEPIIARFNADPAATNFVFVTDERDSSYLTVNLGVRFVHARGLVSYAQYETVRWMDSYDQAGLSLGVRKEF